MTTGPDWGRRLERAARDPAEAVRIVRSRYLHWLFVDLDRTARRTLLVAGSARSGTTWLAQVINHDNAYRYVFEPFRPNRLRQARALGPRRYFRPQDDDPARLAGAGEILTGRARGRWADQMNRKVIARRRLVKDVWANLALGWVHEQFPQVTIVLLLRHPCAVVSSQLLVDWDWLVDVDGILGQPELMHDHLEPLRDVIASASSPFERHVVTWCVENLVPLRQLTAGRVHVVLYEHLVANPAGETERLFRFLGRPLDTRVLSILARPSPAARDHSAIVTGRGLVEAWVPKVSQRDLRWGVRALEAFGLDRLYGADPVPNIISGEQALAGSGVIPA